MGACLRFAHVGIELVQPGLRCVAFAPPGDRRPVKRTNLCRCVEQRDKLSRRWRDTPSQTCPFHSGGSAPRPVFEGSRYPLPTGEGPDRPERSARPAEIRDDPPKKAPGNRQRRFQPLPGHPTPFPLPKPPRTLLAAAQHKNSPSRLPVCRATPRDWKISRLPDRQVGELLDPVHRQSQPLASRAGEATRLHWRVMTSRRETCRPAIRPISVWSRTIPPAVRTATGKSYRILTTG
jgi:hypothetical protein